MRNSNHIYAAGLIAVLLAGCGGGGSSGAAGGSGAAYTVPASGSSSTSIPASTPAASTPAASTPAASTAAAYQVGTTTSDPNLPAAPTTPTLPPANAACRLTASYATQSNGLLPTTTEATAGSTAPDTARIQAALYACANAANAYTATNTLSTNGVVELSANGANNAFLTGPLSMSGGVTLVIDGGVTLFASRDPTQYESGTTGASTANLPGTPNAAPTGATTSAIAGNGTYYCGQIYPNDDGCKPLISNVVYSGSAKIYTSNNAIMGPGTIDGQGGQPLYTTAANLAAAGAPPLITRPDGSNMSWWDLGWEGNEAISGEDENNPRLIEPLYGYNFTLYNLTLQNAPKFHVTPTGINGFTAWNVKIFTPTAVYQAMNNYWGAPYSYASVKNTDGIDPGSKSPATSATPASPALPGGYSGSAGSFTGDISNVLVAYSYISDSDDNMAIKGESNIADGRVYNITVAHNHFFYGHGMSIGSQTSGLDGNPANLASADPAVVANTTPLLVQGQLVYPSVSNVNVYDLSMNYTDNGVRIKTNWSEGGLVSNANYSNICLQGNPSPNTLDASPQAAVIITPYYTPTGNAGLYPGYQNITINGLHEVSAASWTFEGFNSASPNLQGWPTGSVAVPSPAVVNPLGITLNNVVADVTPLSVTSSDAAITLGNNVNVPLVSSGTSNVSVTSNTAIAAAPTVDCSKAFVAFPGQTFP
ncbi:MAG: glycosyl hydrolase family 28 protein [Pseudomonadota bacterium]|jgi:polygalacturonase|uniref:glycosyl hydrolase family 28 protein n=1 Tax=Burkholderiaceae TaxID=119060 RepID=UPI0010F803DF|nr:glycosyl hydrolase family 28 protein [Burkholderia sp. 4M9327F10]